MTLSLSPLTLVIDRLGFFIDWHPMGISRWSMFLNTRDGIIGNRVLWSRSGLRTGTA